MSDQFQIPHELAGDPARQAVSTLLGYIYQIWWSIDAWLQLRTPDEVIFLEGAEDVDRVAADTATAKQIKREAAPISLNNQRAHEALDNFWALREREPSRQVDFHYITTASVATERDAQFGGSSGIEAWRVAQTSLDMASVIQIYLTSKLKPTSPLRLFLASATPEQVQRKLIRRFHWFLEQPGLDEVKQSVDDRLVHFLKQENVPLTYVDRVRNRLHAFACEALVRPESHRRRLSSADLIREIDAATMEHVPIPAHQLQQFMHALKSGALDPGAALLRLMRLPLPAAPTPLLSRPDLVDQVRQRMVERKAALLTGSVYKGKTTVAQLAANALCPDAWWFPISLRSGTETDNLLRALAAVIDHESCPALVIIDDIDLSPSAHAAYRQSLALVVSRASRSGRGLLLTARGASSETAQLSDFAGIETVEVPEMSIEEVQRHCVDNGCVDGNVQAWSTFIRGTTQGHPKLVQVRIAELKARGWPSPQSIDIISGSPAITNARQAARRLLSESVSRETAEFVYTAAEATFPMTRRMLLGLIQLVGGVPNGGDVIDNLQGKWLELVMEERLSVTPMLRGSASEVWLPEQRQLAHRRIYDAITSVRTLDVGDAASLLFHAYIAQDGPRLAHCARLLETIEESTVSSAIFQQLLWLQYVSLSEGQRFFEPNPAVSALLRQLQFSVASEVDSDSLPDILSRWTDEVGLIPNQMTREVMEIIRCSKVSSNRSSRIPLRLKLGAIDSLRRTKGEVADFAEERTRQVIELSRESSDGIPDNATNTQFFMSLQAPSVRNLDDLESVLDWLEHDSDSDSRIAFDGVLRWPLVNACGAFVHGAWSTRHSEETDWNPTLVVLNRADLIARSLGLPQFGSEIAKAASIIYGEYLNDHPAAMRLLDDAATVYGNTCTIREQRVNALFQVKDDEHALEVWDSLIADPDAAKSIDAFAFRRAGISACRLGRWLQAERYFMSGSTTPPELGVEITKFGLVVDASHVVALAGEPQRASRMLSDLFLGLPAVVWEDGHEDWEALFRIVSNLCHLIEAVAKQEDASKYHIMNGKASEPGLSFGPSQPNQVLRTQLGIAHVGLLAARLGSISGEYRAKLEGIRTSDFLLVRFIGAKAALAFEFNTGTGPGFVEALATFERAINTMSSLPDKSQCLQSDGGDTEPTKTMTNINGWFAAFAAAAICCDRPQEALASWCERASAKWGTNSQVVRDLSDMSQGLSLPLQEANTVVQRRVQRSNGEILGAALALLRAGNLNPKATLSIQLSLASATVFCAEGIVLLDLFGKPVARRFSRVWKALALSPYLFTAPRTSVPRLIEITSAVEQGRASVRALLETAAQSIGMDVGDVAARLE